MRILVSITICFCSVVVLFEPLHDETKKKKKMPVRPAKTQISLFSLYYKIV